MTFDEYTQGIDLFEDLADVRDFMFVVRIPPVDFLTSPESKADIVREMYSQMRTVLKSAGLYYDEQIRIQSGDEEIRVMYEDDKFDFTLRAGKGAVAIGRSGSSFRGFHDWYAKVMPYSQSVTQAIRTVIGEKTRQPVDPLNVSFSYKFLLFDFVRLNARIPREEAPVVKNAEVLKSLLERLPGDDGRLAAHPGAENNLARVDVNISRMGLVGSRRRNFWFKVEAPANKGWRSIHFDLVCAAGSHTTPDGAREKFDESACDDWDVAYTDFLRTIGIQGFLSSLLDGYRFKSTPGDLP